MSESAIFNAAAKLPLDLRPAFLDQACGQNADQRREIESLLAAHDASGILRDDRTRLPATGGYEPLSERPGTVIGPYKLMEQIGEGGFGLVFVAEQQQPVRRKVALKIIKPGMDTRDVVARFEAERQALALMDHPNIARVFDGGQTDSGRPFFVMELVKGVPINEYCDQQQLSTRDRLSLFLSVCQAVQHAHAKGVIHRDLKPSNVLVAPHDGVPVVKVIDFGVAKAIGQQLTDKTIYTRFTQMIGTPLYMSPEQAELNALDIDTRSDVYSLGVLLYELLTGTTPFDRHRFRKAAFDEIRRIIREEEPPKPSTRLSTMGETLSKVSSRRGTEPNKLSAQVKGDLDWIVMKALEKDRARRYETASGFAADVRRFLAEEPIEARPPSLGYRVRKFVRRNRGPVIAVTVFLGLLCLGLAGTILGLLQAEEAADLASRSLKVAEDAVEAESIARKTAQHERDATRLARDELRRTLYRSNLNLTQAAWEANNTARVLELLEATRPGPGEEDLRGFEWHYWNRLCHPEGGSLKLNFSLPAASIPSEIVVFSASGDRCAAVTPRDPAKPSQLQVKVWDTADGSEVWSFPLDEAGAIGIALSGDGKRLALAANPPEGPGAEGRIIVWSVDEKKELVAFKTPVVQQPRNASPRVMAPMLSHDGGRLAASVRGMDGSPLTSLMIWDLAAGANAQPTKYPGVQRGAALSPDGTHFATLNPRMNKEPERTLRYELQVREALTGKVVATGPWPTLSGPQAAAGPNHLDETKLMYSLDGSRLAALQFHRSSPTSLPSTQGVVWDARGKLLNSFQSPAKVFHPRFSPDGKRLATWAGERINAGTVWDTDTGETVRTLKGHVTPVVGASFNGDGTRIWSVDLGGNVRSWDASLDTVRRADRGTETVTVWSLDGSRKCVFSRNGFGEAISVRTPSDRELTAFKEHQARIESVQLSPDGRYAVSSDRAGTLFAWETATGKVGVKRQWPAPPKNGEEPNPRFSDDGRRLAMNVPEGGMKVWNLADGFKEKLACAARTRYPVLDSRGRRLATTDEPTAADHRLEREVTVWDIDRGESRCVLKGRIARVLFSQEGNRIAAILFPPGQTSSFLRRSDPVEVKVYDTATGTELAHLKEGASWGAMALSPDGTLLAATAPDAGDRAPVDILVWDVATGKLRLRLKGHTSPVNAITFGPDGRRIASSAQRMEAGRGEAKLWDALAGTELLSLRVGGLVDLWGLLAFSPDGHRLLASGNPGTEEWVQIWDATPRVIADR